MRAEESGIASQRDAMLLSALQEACDEFERTLVRESRIPDRRKFLLNRCAPLLKVLGGVLLGLNVGLVAVLVTFIVFNRILHHGF